MPRLYDRTHGFTEEDLIKVSKLNSWTVGDVLSAYTGQVKIFRIFEELRDNGDLRRWSLDNHCSEKEMYDNLMNFFDDKSNMRIYGHLHDAEVRCIVTLCNGSRIYLYLPVKPDNESYVRLESRIRKLEKLIKL